VYTSINPTVKPFDDIDCRKAVMYAVDHAGYQLAYGGEFSGGDVAKGAAICGQKLAIGKEIHTEVLKAMDQPADQVDLDEVPEEVTAAAKQTVAANTVLRLDHVENSLVDIADGREIGTAVLHMNAGLPEGAPVEATFQLTQDGRLHVTGRDLSDNGKEINAVVETNRSLSEQEMEEANHAPRPSR
jgi:molecular chaperone DnaK (HSP70)